MSACHTLADSSKPKPPSGLLLVKIASDSALSFSNHQLRIQDFPFGAPTRWGGGGADLRYGHFSAEMYAEKNWVPWVGGPAAPPGSATDQYCSLCKIHLQRILCHRWNFYWWINLNSNFGNAVKVGKSARILKGIIYCIIPNCGLLSNSLLTCQPNNMPWHAKNWYLSHL